MSNTRINWASFIIAIFSLAFLVTGIVLLALKDSLIDKAVRKECQLNEGTFLYDLWRDSPVPMTMAFYIFDLENEEQFLNGEKARLVQRGPFVYKEKRSKNSIQHYSNGTISYRESRSYVFDRSLSVDDESFQIKTMNLVYMTLINFLQKNSVPGSIRQIVERLLSVTESVTMTRTVKEYLWGYEDPLLHSLKTLLPKIVRDDQISVFASVVNEAQYETWLIEDGVGRDENQKERVEHVGWIERFNFTTELTTWFDQYSNMINGTDSTIWHPRVDKNQRIYSFMNDICRSVYVEFNETVKSSYEIEMLRYKLPSSLFSNSPENQGFCPREVLRNGTILVKCLPDGLFYLTPCLKLSGNSLNIPIPIVASNPHFLFADQSVQQSVQGLQPNENLHRSFMDVEPITGIIMNGSRRMQFNLNVLNDSNIKTLQKIEPVVFPMMWVDEFAEIDQSSAEKFHKKVLIPIGILHVIKYLFFAIGLVLIVPVVVLMVVRRRRGVQIVTETAEPDERTPLVE